MILKWDGQCERCGAVMPKGMDAHYSTITRKVAHYNCPNVATKDETPEQLAKRLHFVGLGEEATVEWSKLRYEVSE